MIFSSPGRVRELLILHFERDFEISTGIEFIGIDDRLSRRNCYKVRSTCNVERSSKKYEKTFCCCKVCSFYTY